MSEAKIDKIPCIFPASREFRFSETGSLETASSSGESIANRCIRLDSLHIEAATAPAPASRQRRPARCGDLAPPLRNRWFADSPLEGAGLELMVPQSIQLDDVNGGRHAGGKSDIFATRTAH